MGPPPVASEVTAKPWSNAPPQPWGYGCPSRSCGDYIHRSLYGLLPGPVLDHTRPGSMGLSQSHPKSWPELDRNAPHSLGDMGYLLRSRGQHVTMCNHASLMPPRRQAPSWKTWDLRVPTLFPFHYSILLCANASLIALAVGFCVSMLFPDSELFVCAPVSCSHPCLLPPPCGQPPELRYSPVPIPIAYVSL